MIPDAFRIHIGTSGWNYKHWKGPFYPENLSSKDWFSYYAQRFRTVEINNSFYRLPARKTFAQWQKNAPEGFFYSVKASRYITHIKKLKDPEEPVANFMENVRGLGEKLGPVLFQLPPRWKCNPDRLAAFLEAVPADCRCAMEFRDETWWDPGVYEVLRSHNAAFCIYELAGRQSPSEITADFVYIRLHGPDEAYQGLYADETLSAWADAIRGWAADGLSVYCYFDNDENGYAARNALHLQQKLEIL
ncbi:MAG: DUF72 domain-containing protein [Desulfobacteraceae bacterium]|nr:DUF72 domain-containing protein [Desulfobacteraceae bacterium]